MGAKKHEGIVYSTNPNFKYDTEAHDEKTTLAPGQQSLYVWLESKGRNGKTVTIIKGFQGKKEDLNELAIMIKRLCGTGGSIKETDVLIQGDFREKILIFLLSKGYKVKRAGG